MKKTGILLTIGSSSSESESSPSSPEESCLGAAPVISESESSAAKSGRREGDPDAEPDAILAVVGRRWLTQAVLFSTAGWIKRELCYRGDAKKKLAEAQTPRTLTGNFRPLPESNMTQGKSDRLLCSALDFLSPTTGTNCSRPNYSIQSTHLSHHNQWPVQPSQTSTRS